jgi:UDP-glucose 4-epimerase
VQYIRSDSANCFNTSAVNAGRFAVKDQEILKGFFYDVQCAVVMHFSAWSAVY